MNNEVEQGFIGFLADDGDLYCSRECSGGRPGREVDLDEYESFEEGRRVKASALCPGCGAELPVDWPERDRMAD